MLRLSPSEQVFVTRGIDQNLRCDGRARADHRPFSIETGLVSQANGSARIRIDATDVLVGVKAEVGEPDDVTPDEGKVFFSVECSPAAFPESERRDAEDFETELAQTMQGFMAEGTAIDRKALSLVPGQQCWVLYIDAVVLDTGGSLLDAISIATRAALYNTTLPRVAVVPSEQPGVMDLDVSDDPYDVVRLDVGHAPVCVSLTKIGANFVVDASLEEEACQTSTLTVAVSPQGEISGMQKGGPGGLDTTSLFEMVKVGKTVGTKIIRQMDVVLKAEEEERKKRALTTLSATLIGPVS